MEPIKQIVSCSGASNTGKYSDEIARIISHQGKAKMLCLARFSVDKPFAESAKAEIEKLMVLDGCPINCAEKTIKNNGINNCTHVNVTEFGIVKGQTPFDINTAKDIADKIAKLF